MTEKSGTQEELRFVTEPFLNQKTILRTFAIWLCKSKEQSSCSNLAEQIKNVGTTIYDHFRKVTKMVEAGLGTVHSTEDVLLSRYVRCIIVMNSGLVKQGRIMNSRKNGSCVGVWTTDFSKSRKAKA